MYNIWMLDIFNTHNESAKLYHCLHRAPQGAALLPTCEREIDGVTDHYLFAATCVSKSLAFAFSYHGASPEIVMNGGIYGTSEEFCILIGGDETLNAKRNIQVLSFSSAGFKEIGHGSRQAVSTAPLPFSQTSTILETDNIDDLMRNGLQIFCLNEPNVENALEMIARHDAKSTMAMLTALMVEENMRWINVERSISPYQKLRKSFAKLGFPDNSQLHSSATAPFIPIK